MMKQKNSFYFLGEHKKVKKRGQTLPPFYVNLILGVNQYLLYKMQAGGSSENPIDLDYEGAKFDIQEIKERTRNRQIIQEAKLAKKPFYLGLAVVKTTIEGSIGHKNKTLNRAIIKFFQQKIGINISIEHFNSKRPDPNYFDDNKINPKEFIIYGVDFLTTTQLRDRLNVFQTSIKEIQWIDSSTCKVKYNTESEAKKVLESVVVNKENLKIKVQQNDNQYPQGWFLMENYLVYYFERQLLIRYSTEQENDLEKQSLEKYQKYEEVQGELLPYLFKQFHAMEAYEQVIKEIQREKNEETLRINKHRNRERDWKNRRDHRSRTRDRAPRNSRQPINTSFQYNRRSYQPSRSRMRQHREDMEDKSPFDRNRVRNQYGRHNSRERRLGPPIRGNAYYDCNDIEDDLSFDVRSREQHHQSDDDDLELEQNNEYQNSSKKNFNANLSYILNSSINEISKGNSQNLSFVFNEPSQQKNNFNDLSFILNNSLIQKNNKDLSFVMNQSKNEKNNDKNEDLSMILNQSRVERQNQASKIDTSLVMGDRIIMENQDLSMRIQNQSRAVPPQQEQDFSILLGINQQLSSIHQQNQNLNEQVIKEEVKPNKEQEEHEYIDFVPRGKKKQKETIFLDEDSNQGY